VTASPNPYRPPAARISREESGDVVVRPRGLSIVAIVSAVVTVILAGIVPQHLESFRALFADFGAEIPWLSQVALGGAWIWTLLAVAAVGIAIWIAGARVGTRVTIRRMRLTLVAYLVLLVAAFLVTLIALYLPVFTLGRVV
jgi:hypothetical protein